MLLWLRPFGNSGICLPRSYSSDVSDCQFSLLTPDLESGKSPQSAGEEAKQAGIQWEENETSLTAAESRGVTGNSFSAFCAFRIIAPPLLEVQGWRRGGGKGIQNQLLVFAHWSKGLFKISFFIQSQGTFAKYIYTFVSHTSSKNSFIHLFIHWTDTVTPFLKARQCVRSWTCISSCAENPIRKMNTQLGSAWLTGKELGCGSWALASVSP